MRTVLLGTQFYAGSGDAARRQANAADSMTALRGVELANVQWRDEIFEHRGFETVAALEQDSRTIAGAPGPRRPILSEIFDVLARTAKARRLRYFAFVNSDIIVLPSAIAAIDEHAKETYAFSRMDFDRATGRDTELVTTGLDAFVMDVDWWDRHRHRFRPYVLGEWCYDCVFAAILMTFGNGLIFNRAGEIRHEMHAHAVTTMTSRSARFNQYLAALDSRLFTLWAHYHAHLAELRARGVAEAEERKILERDFVWAPSARKSIWHAGRCLRARLRYARQIRGLAAAAR